MVSSEWYDVCTHFCICKNEAQTNDIHEQHRSDFQKEFLPLNKKLRAEERVRPRKVSDGSEHYWRRRRRRSLLAAAYNLKLLLLLPQLRQEKQPPLDRSFRSSGCCSLCCVAVCPMDRKAELKFALFNYRF